MSFDRAFRELMPHTVIVSTVATLGVGGGVTYSTSSASYRARVVNTNRQVYNSRGQLVAAAQEAWIASTSILSPNSKFTLPDGSTPPVLSVDVFPDEDGHHHVRVTFGRS